MDGNALNVVARYLDLTSVQAATNLNLQWTDSLGNRAGATDGACRAVERGQKSSPSDLTSLPRYRASSRRTLA